MLPVQGLRHVSFDGEEGTKALTALETEKRMTDDFWGEWLHGATSLTLDGFLVSVANGKKGFQTVYRTRGVFCIPLRTPAKLSKSAVAALACSPAPLSPVHPSFRNT